MGNHPDVDVLPIAEPPPIEVAGGKEQIQRQDTGVTTKLSRWWHHERSWDELERRLYPKVKEDPSLKDFLDDYAEIKRKPGRKLFDHLVRYSVVDKYSADRPRSEWHPLNDDELFSSGLQSLRAALTAGSPNSLRFCVISQAPPDFIKLKAFSFRAKLFTSFQSLNRRYEAPKVAIMHILDQEWILPDSAKFAFTNVAKTDPHSRTYRLPSEHQTPSDFSLNSDKPLTLHLFWMAKAPRYLGDLYTYVWQPYIKLPETELADVFLSQATSRPRNILILLKSATNAAVLLSEYHKQLLEPLDSAETGEFDSPTEILESVFRLFQQLIADSKSFLVDANGQISILTFQGRDYPSAGKLHYLLHLADCLQASSSGLNHALLTLRNIQRSTEGEGSRKLQHMYNAIRDDIQYLVDEHRMMKGTIEELRIMIRQQLDLRHIRRTSILALLAAIYIPFSFMSSLFGMNLKDPLWSSAKPVAANISRIINPTITSGLSDSSLILANGTNTLLSATSNSASHLWDFKSYWYLTVPITVATIVLPLIAGKIFRTTLQSFYRYQFYWRASLVVCFLAALVVINIEIPPLSGFILYIALFGTIQGVVAFIGLTWASIAGKRQIIWVGFSAILILSLSIDLGLLFISETVGLSGFLPLVFLFMTWTRDDSLALISIAFQHLRSWIPSKIFDSLGRALKVARSHLGWCQLALAICLIALFLALRVTIPPVIYLGFVSGAFGPLAYNRLLRSLTRRERNYWITFPILVTLSIILDWRTRSGSGGYLPILYLYCGWARKGLVSFTKMQLRRLSKLIG